jgi:asparagine synthase (glutamine-hydrolysing)
MGFSPYSGISEVELIQRNTRLPDLLMGLQNRFEVSMETEDLLADWRRDPGTSNGLSRIKSTDLLNYNLRMLLHRNDSIGMAASIESRFPFLDTGFVRLSVNMPYRMKVRFSPFSWNGNRSPVQNKWVLRKVADRYLPRAISQGRKKPLNSDHYNNLRISADFFKKSFIADLFDLSSRGIKYLIEQAPHGLILKLMHLEVWAHVCLNGLPNDEITRKLMTHAVLRTPAVGSNARLHNQDIVR